MDACDDLIYRQSPPGDPARIAAVVASNQRFAYFGTAAFAVRLRRRDQQIASGVPMSLKRVANVLNTDAMLFQEILRSAFEVRRSDGRCSGTGRRLRRCC
jgi:hypothetical protein